MAAQDLKANTSTDCVGINTADTINDLRSRATGLESGVNSKQQTVLLFGDSYTDAQQSQNTLYPGECLSISAWRFVFGRYGNSLKTISNQAKAGSSSEGLLDRLPNALSIYTDWVFMNIGANDFFNSAFTSQYVFDNMKTCITALLEQGRKIILLSASPQLTSRASFSDAKSLEVQLYNRLMSDWSKTQQGLFFINTYQNAVDWDDTVSAGALDKDLITDGVHLSITSGIEVASEVAKVMDSYVSQDTSLAIGPTMPTVFGAGKTTMNGTGGTASTNVTGTVADLYTATVSTGTSVNVVAEKISPVGQRFTCTIDSGGATSIFKLNTGGNSALTAVIGESVITSTRLRVRTISGSCFLKQLSTRLYAVMDGDSNNRYNGRVQGSLPTQADTTFDTGVILLDTHLLPITHAATSSSGYYLEIELGSDAGAVVEMEIYSIDSYTVTTLN